MDRPGNRVVGVVASSISLGWLLGAGAWAQVPMGPGTVLNEIREGFQVEPSVAFDGSGRAITAWTDGYVVARVVDAGDVGGPIARLDQVDGYAGPPRSTVRADGRTVVVWRQSYRVVDFDDLSLGEERTIAPEEQYFAIGSPDATFMGDGTFIIAFGASDLALDDPNHPFDVFVRLFNAAGDPLGPPRLVVGNEPGDQAGARIASDARGRFVVIWVSDQTEELYYFHSIYGRRFDEHGAPLGEPFRIDAGTGDPIFSADVAMNRDGGFVVSWSRFGPPGADADIFYRLYSEDGSPATPELRASEQTIGPQIDPALAMDAAGNFVLVWDDVAPPDDTFEEIQGRLFRPDGSPVGHEFRLTDVTPDDYDEIPAVALADNGTILAAWGSWREENANFYGFDIEARRFFRGCQPGASRLTLHGGRFEVCASYRTLAGTEGVGVPLPLTPESGGFWFFSPDNLEVVLKLLDGCGTNGNYWIYSAGLTNLEVTVGVIDTWSGQTWVFDNDQATAFPPVGEITSLPVCHASPKAAPLTAGTVSPGPPLEPSPIHWTDSTFTALPANFEGTCVADATHLCLQSDRFRVSARFATPGGELRDARVVPLGTDSGALWFFWPANLELFVKVLDACGLADFESFWVYAAGLTDLEVELTVVDTRSGTSKTYRNPQHRPYPAVLDSQAFNTCDTP